MKRPDPDTIADNYPMSRREHALFLTLFLILFAVIFHALPGPPSPQDTQVPFPITTTQALYEAQRIIDQRALDEDPFLETPEEKRHRILARDEAALLSNLRAGEEPSVASHQSSANAPNLKTEN